MLGFILVLLHFILMMLTIHHHDRCQLSHARPQLAAGFRRGDGRAQPHACRQKPLDHSASGQQCTAAPARPARRRSGAPLGCRRCTHATRTGFMAGGARSLAPIGGHARAQRLRAAAGRQHFCVDDGRRHSRRIDSGAGAHLRGRSARRVDPGAATGHARPAAVARRRGGRRGGRLLSGCAVRHDGARAVGRRAVV